MSYKNNIAAVSLVCIGFLGFPQCSFSSEHESALWLGATFQDDFGDDQRWSDWSYQINVQARRYDALEGAGEVNAGVWLSYRLPKRFRVAGSFRYFQVQPDNGPKINERRLSAQVSWNTGGWWGSTFGLRTRLEHRDVVGRSGTDWRLRQQFRLDIPLQGWAGKNLVLGLEPFFSLNSTDWVESGFVQHRTFIGIATALSPRIRMEAGYMHQLITRSERPDFNNHVLLANFRYR